MKQQSNKTAEELPPIPAKRFFSIREAAKLCGVKPHVLRYWEAEFSKLKPTKGNGGHRHYAHKDIELIREIRGLLYDQGFTIAGAKQQLKNSKQAPVIVQPEPQNIVESEQIPEIPQQRPLGDLIASMVTDLKALIE